MVWRTSQLTEAGCLPVDSEVSTALADEGAMKRKDVPALLKQLLTLAPAASPAVAAPAVQEKPLMPSLEAGSPKRGSASKRKRSSVDATSPAGRSSASKPSR